MQTISVSQHGSKTEKNEDAYLVLDYQNLYLVADGVGGGPSGDFASRILVDRVYSKFKSGKVDQDTLFGNNSAVLYGDNTASYGTKVVRLTEEEYL